MTEMPTILPTYARADLAFVRGSGPWVFTKDDVPYLDFGAGIAVNALGHANPDLVKALTAQANQLWHTSNLYHIPNQQKLADQLVEASFADTVFFTNSGAEAMECAVKMARKFHFENGAPERTEIIAFENSFHGRTLGMISAAGSEKLTHGFGPLLPGFVHLPFGDHDALMAAISETTAAIILEPIQGEGGILPVPDQCMQGLRDLCDKHGILLILDEVQCGMGRTGRLFAHEWSGIKPDIMAIAKAIGGGFPIGACLATAHAAKGMTAGAHGSTYGGNPLGCAVGSAVMNVIVNEGFLQEVSRKAGRLRQGLESLVAEFPNVFEAVRGAGLMLGLVCKVPNTTFVNAGYQAGILTVPGGQNVVRLLPPLNIPDADLNEGLTRLRAAAAAV